MQGGRIVQAAAAIVVLLGALASSRLLPALLRQSEQDGLRYTADPIEGAPPIVALGNAIGVLRSIIADYLWIKLGQMKEKGQFYEANTQASWITKLQPRFPEVWGFHGHNLAYNISVMTNTPQERWAWVNAGINLVRNQGLRYNPNDLGLNKELGFWFAHKVDGVSDDAHLFYKRELAKEWQFLLGIPPYDAAEREKWMRYIAEAPDTLEELVARDPQVQVVIDRLTSGLSGFDKRFAFRLDRDFLLRYGRWLAVKQSPTAQILQMDATFKANDPIYAAMDSVCGDPELKKPVNELIAFLRKKVLRDDYNMDAKVMADYTRDFGPIDWRHPQAHALYWAKRGDDTGSARYSDPEDVYKAINNDRIWMQAFQALARTGLMAYDPFSNDNPTRLNDTRWIHTLDRYFREIYEKYRDRSRGGGVDTFADQHENFLSSAVRELYRAGDVQGAQRLMDELDQLYGTGAPGPLANNKYQRPLDVFVRETTFGEYEFVPDTARTDVYSALQRGFREGLLLNQPQVLKDARQFAKDLTDYFKNTKYFDFTNKFGEGRMRDLIGSLEKSEEEVFTRLMVDPSLPLVDRLTIYNRAGEELRRLAYDGAKDQIRKELAASPIGRAAYDRTLASGKTPEEAAKAVETTFLNFFPEPPGMDAYRAAQAAKAQELERQRQGGGDTLRR